MPEGATTPDPVPDQWLPWLADAPMFIDGRQIASFYDAVVRPTFKTLTLEISKERVEELEKSFGVKLGAKLPAWFPWLKGEGGFEGGLAKTSGESEGETITLQAIDNPTRQLVELSLHYLVNQPDRVWFHQGTDWDLPADEVIETTPRILAFVDFPPRTKFLPMAAELNDGRVVTFFDQLVQKFKTYPGTLPVRYPDDVTTDEGKKQRDDYWYWFSEHWSAIKALQVIEEEIGSGGRPRWIDYRVPVDGETLHLHIVGHGEVDTGMFAYNLVKRGWKHGVRAVGSLKSEPDLNVLAIYEK